MKFHLSIFLLVGLLCQAPNASAAAEDSFLAAREAVRLGDEAKLERLGADLQGHDLQPYLDYWRLFVRLSSADPVAVQAFLTRHDQSYLANKLRGEWLKQLGKNQQWAAFDAEYPAVQQPDQTLLCYALQRRLARQDAAALNEAMPLWLSLTEPPSACDPVLEALILEKRVHANDVWARIRRQVEANRNKAARVSMNYLPASQTPSAALSTAALENSLSWLSKRSANNGTRMERELTALAIARIARKDPRMAATQLSKHEAHLQAGEKNWAWGQIAWQAAQRHLPEATEWFAKAGNTPLSDEVAQWKVRAALRDQNWPLVRSSIEQMPPALAEQATWVYWLGRAHQAARKNEDATRLFTKIAGQPNFYGNLADEELGRLITIPPQAPVVTASELEQASTNASFRRALLLFKLGLRLEGVREWNWALRGMNDRELLASAELALRSGIYDRAISAADRTQNEHDYAKRYLAPFSEQVRPAAANQGLDDAWVYGLMRQESRFITDAKSTVGASGLMQLMPATAKWVAKKIGLNDFKHSQVNDTETNVLLGTSYMRLVLESLDNHPVLASAAYNAGPGRAQRWRAEQALEGAIYAETIPFSETRDYVKKVISNAMYYSLLFNEQPVSIKHRLGQIEARAGANPKAEALP